MIQHFVGQMLYPVPSVPVPTAPTALEEIRLQTAGDDTVIGWYGAAPDGDAGPRAAGVQVLYLHGNGENLATLHRAGVFQDFAALGASVLALDYPGYGRSGGKPSQRSNVAAALAGCEWLAARDPQAATVVMGWSLGAAVAAQTARLCARRPDAVILASAWNDLASIARDHFPALLVSLAVTDDYDSAEALQNVDLPILMIHGAEDDLIATRHGRDLRDRLMAAERDVTWVEVPGAGHNDLMGRDELWRAVAQLVASLRASRAEPGAGR